MTWLVWYLRCWWYKLNADHVEWLSRCSPEDPELRRLTEQHHKRLRHWQCQEPL